MGFESGALPFRALVALAVFGGTLAATLYFVAQARAIARRLGLLGRVGARHRAPAAVPRLGGVGIFLGVSIGIGLSFVLPVTRYPDEIAKLVLFVLGGLIVFAVSLADDLVELGAVPRLVWFVVAAAFVVLPRLFDPWRLFGAPTGIVITELPNPFGSAAIALPLVVALPFTVLWIVGLTNAINWIDAVDGLSGGVVLIASAVLFIHTALRQDQFTIALIPLVLGAAALGFLRYNWPPATIIMGDSGAMFFGYALAVAAIIGGAKIATTLLVLIVPAVNMAWAVLVRLLRGANPLHADESHLHDRLRDLGFSPRAITLLAYAICVAFGGFALIFDKHIKLVLFGIVAAAVLVGLLLVARRSPAGDHAVADDPARMDWRREGRKGKATIP